ncbi:MAG: protoheme IX farnesyltransferase, partial [Steroidobacteraceae bacterium]
MNHTDVQPASVAARWHDYLQITKPRVVALIVLTSLVGSLLAAPALP